MWKALVMTAAYRKAWRKGSVFGWQGFGWQAAGASGGDIYGSGRGRGRLYFPAQISDSMAMTGGYQAVS